MDTSFITSILSSPDFTALLLTTFAGVVTAVVGWVAIQVRRRILHDLSASELALLREIASVAVRYAEQKFADADGPAKLAEAIKAADVMIASYGLSVTIEQLTSIVEAAVYGELAHTDIPAVEPAATDAPVGEVIS